MGGAPRAFLERWFEIDLRSLAIFRVALGVILLVDLASRARLLEAAYTDAGAFPRELAHGLLGTLLSLHLASGAANAQWALFAAAGLAAALLTVGWQTRAATFVSWLLLASLEERNPLLLDGGDHLLRLLLFWGVFLPLGARWSLDEQRRGPPPVRSVSSPASAALLLQVGGMFFMTGLLKTGPEWSDGTAIAYAISRKWWILPFGEWLLAHPWLLHLLTPAVRWFERLGPLLLFAPVATAPLRLLGISGFWALLAGLGLGLWLNLFPFIAGSGLLPFVPGLAWEVLARRFPQLGVRTGGPPPPPTSRAAWGASDAVVLGLLALVVWINVGTLSARAALPSPLKEISRFLMIEQNWSMYAPSPRHVDVWFEHHGRLASGAAVELDGAAGGAAWTDVERAWRDYRFQYYLQKLAAPKWRPEAAAYAEWLCRRWNADHHGGERLYSLTLTSVIQPISVGDEPKQPAQRRQAAYALCPD